MPKLSRVRQLAAKIESVEGTAETLTAAEAKYLVYDPKVKFDVGMFQRNPARASLAQMTRIPGLKKATLTARLEVRGSGTAATAPEWFTLLQRLHELLRVNENIFGALARRGARELLNGVDAALARRRIFHQLIQLRQCGLARQCGIGAALLISHAPHRAIQRRHAPGLQQRADGGRDQRLIRGTGALRQEVRSGLLRV